MNKTFFKLVFFLFALQALPVIARSERTLKIEILCPASFQTVKLKDLCPKDGEDCEWEVLKRSPTATHWKKGKELQVKEIPGDEGLKVFWKSPLELSELELPWCFKGKVPLTVSREKIKNLKELRKHEEVLYLLPEGDMRRLPLLKKINNPCRKLEKVSFNGIHYFYFLSPQPLKACQK